MTTLAPFIPGVAYISFFSLPVIITAPGQYLTRGGEVVTVEVVSTRHDHGCRGFYSCGIAEGWHKTGRIYFGQECCNDIVAKA